MKYLITRNPLVMWVIDKIHLVEYIFHCFFMERYLEEWAAVEGKTLEQFKEETFCSGKEAYQNFLNKFDIADFDRFKRQYFINILSR